MSEEGLPTLPAGWAWAKIADLGVIIRGVTYRGEDARAGPGDDLIPILRANNIERSLTFAELVYVPSRYVSAEQLLTQGDIVIAASSGSRAVVGKSAPLVHQWNGSFGAFCYALRPIQRVNSAYIAWFMQTEEYRRRVSLLAAGVNINNLRRNHIEDTSTPLPPLPEQRRIVAAIEEQFSRLDAAVAALRRVQANLKRYRASVLKAACEGRLVATEAELARREGREYEPASALLGRMLPDEGGLGELPEGWAWTHLRDVADIKGGITKGQARRPGDKVRQIPYLRVANVQRGYLDLADVRYIEATEKEIDELRLRPGDVLLNEGGDRDKLGRGWVWRGELPECIHQNHVFRARIRTPALLPVFVSWYGNTAGQEYFLAQGRQTTNLASINLTKLSALPVPIPPLAEQRRIVAEVERRLSVVQAVEEAVAASLKRAGALRQAILRRAFAGKLVPQDPNDEPASVLLERIRAERRRVGTTARVRQSRRGARQARTAVLPGMDGEEPGR